MNADAGWSCFVPRAKLSRSAQVRGTRTPKALTMRYAPGPCRGRPPKATPTGRPAGQQLGACHRCMLAACNGACMIEQTSCYHTTHELVYGDDGSDEEKCIDQALVFFFSVMAIDYATVHNHTCTAHDRSSEGFWVPTSIGIG